MGIASYKTLTVRELVEMVGNDKRRSQTVLTPQSPLATSRATATMFSTKRGVATGLATKRLFCSAMRCTRRQCLIGKEDWLQ